MAENGGKVMSLTADISKNKTIIGKPSRKTF